MINHFREVLLGYREALGTSFLEDSVETSDTVENKDAEYFKFALNIPY